MNKNNYLMFILLFMIIPLKVSLADEDGDWQFRAMGIISRDFNAKFRLQIGQQTHFDKANTSHHLFKSITDIGVWYRVSRHLIISLDYKQDYSRENSNWFLEKRPHFNIRLRWEWFGLRIENKNRLEFRYRQDSAFENRYRNRIWIRKPIQYSDIIFQPYIMDELFFNLGSDGFNRNRISLGLQVGLGNIQPELFGFWQKTDEGGYWIDEYIAGFKVIFFLR